MKRLSLIALLSLAFTTSVFAQSATFGGVLTGSQEDPPNSSAGFGNTTVTLDAAHTTVNVTLNFSKLTGPVVAYHLHRRAADQKSGSPLIGFPLAQITNGQANLTLPIVKADGDALFTNPELFYVNLHTATFPQGEIRGDLSTISGAGIVTLAATLRGNEETPPNNSTGVGTFFATIDENNNMTYELNVFGVPNVTLAHIHPGALGVAGSPLIGLTAPTSGRSSGTVPIGSISADRLADIRGAAPQNFYVNVHTTAFPGGELRGQLVPANEYDIAVAGKVTVFVTDVRIFNPSFTSRAAALVEYFPAGASGNTVASRSGTFDIAPRGTRILDDITGATLLNQTGITGGLRISSTSKLAITSRIFADQRAANLGTIGQFVPAQQRSAALRRGVLPNLSFNTASPPSGSRTNLGIFNPNGDAVNSRMTLFDPAGTALQSIVLSIPPLSQQQASISSFFSAAAAGGADFTVSFDASAPIFVYGSVVDNVSTDQIFVVAQEDVGVATAP